MTAQTPDFASMIDERALDVYWDKALVGRLMQNAAGSLRFAYDPGFLQSAMNKQLKVMAENTMEKALMLKESLESQGLSSPVFSGICQIIQRHANSCIM